MVYQIILNYCLTVHGFDVTVIKFPGDTCCECCKRSCVLCVSRMMRTTSSRRNSCGRHTKNQNPGSESCEHCMHASCGATAAADGIQQKGTSTSAGFPLLPLHSLSSHLSSCCFSLTVQITTDYIRVTTCIITLLHECFTTRSW
jgi:hypothetical protein